MNVRFFSGTRVQYDSLKTPRNPLGLYFCSDTKELFWGDRLLTDGIRVVPTFKDLPALASAADGVVYYITESRNGYTLSPDRSEWLQTIYAPATDAYKVPENELYNTVTTVGAVRDIEAKIYETLEERIANIEIGTSSSGIKTLYFAGVKFDESDGAITIDRLCALRALGFDIPEDSDINEIEFVTKDYIDTQIAAIEAKIPNIDNLVTQLELETTLNSIEQSYVTKETLVNNYITTTELQKTYVTQETVTDVVTQQIETTVTGQIELKVTEVIQDKIDKDEISIKTDAISYGDF